jgi:hypothetical protein
MKSLPNLFRIIFSFVAFGLFPFILCAGNIHLNSGSSNVSINEINYQKLFFSSSISDIYSNDIKSPEGVFAMFSVQGFGVRNVIGEPALPVYRKIVEVPLGASYSIQIIKQHYTDIDLSAAGVNFPVFPAQPPMSKGDDPTKVQFIHNKDVYSQDKLIHDELAIITPIGIMRALNLARVDISPVQYNPVQKILRVYDVLEIEIVFQNANIIETLEMKRAKVSPYFNSTYQMVGNYKPLSPGDGLPTAAPVTYVIISDPMFEATLQPFIQWKTKKGFRVIVGYTNNATVGTTTTSIKAYLQGLYTNPPDGYNVPSFVLFVGDVAQIPAWSGSAGSHYTDLRYCEYTGDNLPEVFYGRFSATSIAQLQPQIDKTLEYEQYLMPDPSFLNEAVMAAGADGSYQTWSNGQIYYGTENYFNAAHNITSHTYLQPEPTGGNYATNIHNNVSNGVAYANYTAHCSESGWANPSFLISDILNLTNVHKYCLMVGNCCLSAKFDVNSFAEEQLRAANKGSVGYIGGSNNTYWDEDYWWGCGFKTVVLHPAYDAAHIGAYDGTFHAQGEPVEDWFVTQGQMVVCGDYAVEESNSSRKTYYWEIYHLMGDPSLMIYYSVPPALTATYQNNLMIGMTSLTVTTEPYAYVALSMNGLLLDAKLADAGGTANLIYTAFAEPGTADIVITKQNRQPLIGTIQVIPASGPYVVYVSNSINDPIPGGNNNGQMEFGESNFFNTSLKNVGVVTANNITATLSTSDTYLTLTDNTENFGNISPEATVMRANAFACTVANNIPDQHIVAFNLSSTNGTDVWPSHFNITANAPVLMAGAMTVLDNGPGCNNDGILDPGETAFLVIANSNTGHASLTNVSGILSIAGGSSPYLVLNNTTSSIGTLANGASANTVFTVTANVLTPIGTPVDLNYTLSGGVSGQYSVAASRQVVIGLIPTYTMSGTTVAACVGNFYDPGGPSATYGDSQDYTMVFNPGSAGSSLRFVFTSFDLESNTTCAYDYLKIYDGNSTSGTLLGTYCGTNSPGTVIANNASGSLTFVFHSDGSVTNPGWEASMSCLSGIVANPSSFIATTISESQIDLSWIKNSGNNNVLLVCSPTVSFGTPVNGTYYSAGGTIPGGSIVLYAGGATAFNHTALNPSTTYYYKAFSYDGSYNYSTGVTTNANTGCGTVSSFPWTEGFEHSGVIPNCWVQEQVNNSGINWTFITGNGGSYPAAAHTGTYNTCLKDNTSADNLTRLILPVFDLAQAVNPRLKFWHTQAFWSPDQDQLKVYYKTSAIGSWTLLNTYTSGISTWTEETISLPGASATYYIAFEGNAKYGYGVCIDDVSVESDSRTLIVNVLLEGLYNGSGSMRKARNAGGDQFTGTTADQITVELHNSANYSTIAHTWGNVNLSTSGTAAITIPGSLSGSYYITIKHRNSIETTTASAVSFSAGSINYNFDAAAKVYGGNMKLTVDGKWVIYSGDTNGDGLIDSGDIMTVDNMASSYVSGYLPEDSNGDGIIDSGDLTIIDNNATGFISSITP